MDFFEELTQRAAQFAAEVAGSVKDFSEKTGVAMSKTADYLKMKNDIQTNKAEIEKLYTKLGESVYQSYQEAINPEKDDPVDQICLQIKKLNDENKDLSSKLDKINQEIAAEKAKAQKQAEEGIEAIREKADDLSKKLTQELDKATADVNKDSEKIKEDIDKAEAEVNQAAEKAADEAKEEETQEK